MSDQDGGYNKPFIDLVQQHERSWGSENYPERPDLAAILGANVVAFWTLVQKEGPREPRSIITLHSDMDSLQKWLVNVLIRMPVQFPDRRLLSIYVKHKRVTIKDVKIIFSSGDETVD